MNYYVPIQQDEAHKKQDEMCKKQDVAREKEAAWSYPTHKHLILGRRFELTSSKYLEVGIRESTFQTDLRLRIGDNRGNCISMPEVVWSELIGEDRPDFEEWMQSTPPATPWEIYHHLTIEIIQIRNENVLKFISHYSNSSIYMKPSTVMFMLNLKQCVALAIEEIWPHRCEVNEKFNKFVSIIDQNRITAKRDALKKLHEVYDENSLIDCELIAYALDNIVYTATYLLKLKK